jgi:hypothetical protein
MTGVLLGSEAAAGNESPDFGVEQVVVANNLILGTHHGVAWWNDEGNDRASNTYLGLEIVSNVLFGQEGSAIMVDEVPSGRTAPSDATLIDNIIYDGGQSFVIGNPEAWTITSNIFPDGAPPEASDASNLEGDPLLAAPAVDASPEDFQPSESSPCRNAGEPVASVPLDFACATRGTDTTTIGAFE